MRSDGFTLIEMLLVLSVISLLLVLFPFLRINTRIQFYYEVAMIKERLQYAQADAIVQRRKNPVTFLGNAYTINEHMYSLQVSSCSATPFHYTPQGSVSNALTIRCRSQGHQKNIVVQLGTGTIYVK